MTRAALILFKELGIESSGDYNKCFGFLNRQPEMRVEEIKEPEKEEEEVIIVSPMKRDEFQRILKDGWGLGNEIVSPIKDEEFQDFMRSSNIDLTMKKSRSSTPFQLESTPSDEPMKKPLLTRKSAPSAPRQLFSMTPSTPRRTSTPLIERTPSLKALPKMDFSVHSQAGETPLENRASRLRRMKMGK